MALYKNFLLRKFTAIWYTVEVASELAVYAAMSTLVHVLSEKPLENCFTKPGCRKYQPHFQLVSLLVENSAP